MQGLAGYNIAVEGNIGSGKSSLTRATKAEKKNEEDGDEINITVFPEPVNERFLAAFYGEPKVYAFALQMYMLTTRLHQLTEGHRLASEENHLVLLDRSPVGDSIFAKLSHENGCMSEQDLDIYHQECQDRLPKSISEHIDCILYLDVEPNECLRRVTTMRKRSAESQVSLEYLTQVDEAYFHLLMEWMAGRQNTGTLKAMNIGPCPPVVCVEWDRYGKTEDVLERVRNVVSGSAPSPTVRFVSTAAAAAAAALDSDSDPVHRIDTLEDIGREYRYYKGKGKCPDRAEAHCLRRFSTDVFIDWNLPHTNEFRRVVFFILSQHSNVVFFSESIFT